MRLCDLGVDVGGKLLSPAIETLFVDLAQRGFCFRPHVWLSDEWFCPDGVPGFAVPFYLAHPRLRKLERRLMHEVEGGTLRRCLRLLRHETGHAIDNAYHLQRNRRRQVLFGPSETPYPDTYVPQRFSRGFVRNLGLGYAQSHPDEDFAETFAVWLDPASRWRERYFRWAAFDKLLYMDEVMKNVANRKPSVRARKTPERLETLTGTLEEHYRRQRRRYKVSFAVRYDAVLDEIFVERGRDSASRFLRRHRGVVRRQVAKGTGVRGYTVDDVLKHWIARTAVRRLFLRRSERRTLEAVTTALAASVLLYVRGRHDRIPL